MRPLATVSAALCLLGTALAAPASAWGTFTHAWIAARAFDQLVPHAPWLAAERDAFLWGAVAADLDHRPGEMAGCGPHSAKALQALWREARAAGDGPARAFALGWATHLASDEVRQDRFADDGGEASSPLWAAVREAAGPDAPALPARHGALVDWAVDAAVVPHADGTLTDLYRAAVLNAGTPAGAPVRGLLAKTIGTDEAAYLGWARLQAGMCLGGLDGYLAARARFVGVEPWAEALRSVKVRGALGDLTPSLTRAVEAGVKRANALLLEPAPLHHATPVKKGPAR